MLSCQVRFRRSGDTSRAPHWRLRVAFPLDRPMFPAPFSSTPCPMSKKSKASSAKSDLHRKHSSIVVDGVERAASRAMYHALGFKREDFKKSQIGIASTWSQ